MGSYWDDRQQRNLDKITDRTIDELKRQTLKYYKRTMDRLIESFENVYAHVQERAAEGHATPADFYKLDAYWKLQAQVKAEAQKLGDREIALMSKAFEKQWKDVYESIALPSDAAFSTLSNRGVQAVVDNVWLEDGKNFSARVWKNTQQLVETLNEELMHCASTDTKLSDLSRLLQERFEVSKHQADTLVTTEATHIQMEAQKQRMTDYGVEYYQFVGREEGPCGHTPDCHDLDGQIFRYSEMKPGVNCPPIHPNCRCAVRPYVPDDGEDRRTKGEGAHSDSSLQRQLEEKMS